MAMSREQQDTQAKAWGRIVARAWSDEAFRLRLRTVPDAVLREYGIELSEGVEVQVHESDADTLHLILPARPAELSDEELDAVAGGEEWELAIPYIPAISFEIGSEFKFQKGV